MSDLTVTDLGVTDVAVPLAPPKPTTGPRPPWGPVRRIHRAVLHIDAATPADRDRAVDVLRALAVMGVVLGHWLVSAIVLLAGGHLAGASPLRSLPDLSPASWLLQPLAVFFFVGGRVSARSYASARAAGTGYRAWLRQRLSRLARPIVPLAGTWALAWVGLVAADTAHETIHTLLWLAFTPLWFLAVYAFMTAVTPLALHRGPQVALVAALVVACLDGARGVFGDDRVVDTLRLLDVPAGWLVPYALGVAWASGHFARRRPAVVMLLGGAGVTAALILWCGYPASMVGVPGQGISNLNPPTAAAVAFGLGQCGAALLLSGPLRRLVGQPGTRPPGALDLDLDLDLGSDRARPSQFLWAAVALLNLSAIEVFLWHQTAMITTTVVSLGLGGFLPGLQTSPTGVSWVVARIGWLPVFAAVLLLLLAVVRSRERRGLPRRPGSVPGSGRPKAAASTNTPTTQAG